MGRAMLSETTVDTGGTSDVFGDDIGNINLWDDDATVREAKLKEDKEAMVTARDISSLPETRQKHEQRKDSSDESSSEDMLKIPHSPPPPPRTPRSRDNNNRKLKTSSTIMSPKTPSRRSLRRIHAETNKRDAWDTGLTLSHQNESVNSKPTMTPTRVAAKEVISAHEFSPPNMDDASSPTTPPSGGFRESYSAEPQSPASVPYLTGDHSFPVFWKADPLDDFVESRRTPTFRRRALNVEIKSQAVATKAGGNTKQKASRRSSMPPVKVLPRPTRVHRTASDAVPSPSAKTKSLTRPHRIVRSASASDTTDKQGLMSADQWTTAASNLNEFFQGWNTGDAPKVPGSAKAALENSRWDGTSAVLTSPRRSLAHVSPSRRRSSSRNRSSLSGLPLAPTLTGSGETSNQEGKDPQSIGRGRRPSLAGRKIKYEKKSNDGDGRTNNESVLSDKQSVKSKSSTGSRTSKGTSRSRRRSASRSKKSTDPDAPRSPGRDRSPPLPPQTPRSERITRRSVNNMIVKDGIGNKPPIVLSPNLSSSSKSKSKTKLVSPSPRRKIKYIKRDSLPSPSLEGKDEDSNKISN